jgi:ABC-type branched-subunit amino acid transport system substrate-binding protein
MTRKFIAGLLLAVTALCWALPLPAAESVFSGSEAPAPDAAMLLQAIELYRAAKADEALPLLRDLALRGTDAPVRYGACLYLARIFHERGQEAEAILYLERIPDGERGAEVRLVEGAIRVATGEPERGEALLLAVGEDRLGDADRILRLTALAEARSRLGQPLEALTLIHQAMAVPAGEGGEALLAQAHALLQDRLDDAQLAEAAVRFRASPVGQDALLQQALRAAARGDTEAARRLSESLLQGGAPFPYLLEAVRLWERLTGKSWLQRAVGVLLPLSGRYATFGELVRRGMDLAQEMHQADGNDSVRFLYRDTGADPVQSERALIELVENERVLAIAGPLTGIAAQTAANQAQKMRVPLLTLSQKEGLPEAGDYVFRDSLTSRQQVLTLVSYAMEERQLTSFAVLYPENRLGREMTELFVREVERRGGRIAARQSYTENLTDFRRQIKQLRREDPNAPDPEPSSAGATASSPKSLSFEGLFIPDDADRIGLIAPQLVFFGIENLPLFGINGWNSPDLVRLAGRFIEGAVFVDGFYRDSPHPLIQEFVDRYFEKYGEEPSILEAQGYDAAGILLSLLECGEIRTREELRLALSRVRDYSGVTGTTSFTQQGDADKNLFLLQVQDGNIVQIN